MVSVGLLFIIIMFTIIFIGYITGATTEMIKLLKLYLPFIVVYYLGGIFSRYVYTSKQFINIFNKIPFIHNITYINTYIILLLYFIVFMGAYLTVEIVMKLLHKKINSEKFTYKLGVYSNRIGGFIGIIRFYIIASVLVIPFFMMGFVSRSDSLTNFVIKNSPPFIQFARYANASEEVVQLANSVSDFLEIIDINNFQDLQLITNLENTLADFETQVNNKCVYQLDNYPYPNLYAYINNPCDDTELELIKTYKGLILWVNDKNTDEIDFINEFYKDYDYIYELTEDSNMLSKLEKTKIAAIIYQITEKWLQKQLGDNYDKFYLQNEEKMNLIIDALIVDFANEKSSGLIHDLKQLQISELNKKLDATHKFVYRYVEEYKLLMEKMPEEMSFSYKLLAAKFNQVDYLLELKQSPLFATYVIDSLKVFSKKEVEFIPGENGYQSLVKIIIPQYFIKNNEVDTKTMNGYLENVDYAIAKGIITEDFFIEFIYALVTAPYMLEINEGPFVNVQGSKELYINYLVNESRFSVEALKVLAESYLLSDDSDTRVQIIKGTLKVGEIDGNN